MKIKSTQERGFLGGPVVKCVSPAGHMGSIYVWGTKIPHAMWHSKKKKKKGSQEKLCPLSLYQEGYDNCSSQEITLSPY